MQKKISNAAINRYSHRYGQQQAEAMRARLKAMQPDELLEFMNQQPPEMWATSRQGSGRGHTHKTQKRAEHEQ